MTRTPTAFHKTSTRHGSANPRLYDIIRESRAARHGVRRDAIIDHEPGRNLPTPWLRTQSAQRTTLKREIRGGRQMVSTLGWDAVRKAHTWQTITTWHDTRSDVVTEHETQAAAIEAANVEAKR